MDPPWKLNRDHEHFKEWCHPDGRIYRKWRFIEAWYLGEKFHREDGPAITTSKDKPEDKKVWFVHGQRIACSSQEEFEKLMKMKVFW
jgi:hypothetical protein